MKEKRNPMRRCAACMKSKPKEELIRIAFYEGNLSVDPTGKAKGRGVYLCQNPQCFEIARKRGGLQRSFKTSFDQEVLDKIFEQLADGKG